MRVKLGATNRNQTKDVVETDSEKLIRHEKYNLSYVNDIGLIKLTKVYTSFGNIYFNETLNDWAKFDINKRTKHDASISSGLAIMACNRHLYKPNATIEKPQLNIKFAKYSNEGSSSKIIK